jgi:hypothetical protein
MKQKIKVGDRVEVVNPNNTYSIYGSMFIKMGFTNTEDNNSWEKGEVGIVFAVDKHPVTDVTLIAIRHSDGREVLMGEEGVELIENVKGVYTVDKQFILDAHKAACSEWKKKLENKYPEVFEDQKYFNLENMILEGDTIFTEEQAEKAGFGSRSFMLVRGSGEFKSKGFYLSDRINWELVTDSEGMMVLLPTKKK